MQAKSNTLQHQCKQIATYSIVYCMEKGFWGAGGGRNFSIQCNEQNPTSVKQDTLTFGRFGEDFGGVFGQVFWRCLEVVLSLLISLGVEKQCKTNIEHLYNCKGYRNSFNSKLRSLRGTVAP